MAMGFGAIQAAAGGFSLLLALAVVWLAFRLKQKNKQLRKALGELQLRRKEASTVGHSSPALALEKAPPTKTVKLETVPANPAKPMADAFLWEHLGDAFLWKHLPNDKPAPVKLTPADPSSIPTGMCDPA